MPAEYRVLGPLEVRVNGQTVPVPAGRARVLLSTLLLRANRFVSVDELIDRLWDGEPPNPDRAKTTLQMVVTRLRQALGDASCVRTMTGGYVAEVSRLDLLRFRELVAADDLAAALDLWRGPMLANVESDTLHRDDVRPLLDERLVVLERRVQVDLERGLAGELVPELRSLTQRYPLRERFWGQLMLALYRAGQQAEALAAYREVSRQLVNELGVDPVPELRELHRRMLSADPELAASAQLVRVRGPRQLPPRAAHFVGREKALHQLADLLDAAAADCPAAVISAIDGAAGIGKTALAVHWAHQVTDRFPDGQLYVNLRGFDPDRAPMAAGDAIRAFLTALDVAPSRIPTSFDEQVVLYRSLLADRQVLVLLDNARDSEQVRPLLPGSAACRVVVTSRNQLTGLVVQIGAESLNLDVLSRDEAVELLRRRLGAERIAAEPGAVEEIIVRCGGLPLALSVVAARAAVTPDLRLADLAEELAQEKTRLEALDTGDRLTSVRAVFSWSYDRLASGAARMFRLLALHPGPHITLTASANLAGTSPAEAESTLDLLARMHLVTRRGQGVFVLHDLLRAYAAHESAFRDTDVERVEALRRLLDHYLHMTAATAKLIYPDRAGIPLEPMCEGVTLDQLADDRQAWAWLDAEYQVLRTVIGIAADHGLHEHAWQIPWLLTTYFERRGHWQDWSECLRIAMASAEHLGDRTALADTSNYYGHVRTRMREFPEARVALERALGLFEQLAMPVREGHVHRSLGWMYEMQGRHADALRHGTRAMDIFRKANNEIGLASALNAIGICHIQLGDPKQALSFCEQSVELQRKAGHSYGEANSLDTLGYAYHHLGDANRAIECYQRSLALAREVGVKPVLAEILDHLGDAHGVVGNLEAARACWREALRIFEDMGHADEAEVRAKLEGAS